MCRWHGGCQGLVFAALVLVATCGRHGSSHVSSQSAVSRSLLAADEPVKGACPALSKEHLSKYAKNNIILLTFTDKVTAPVMGPSWLDNVRTAGISYYMVAALDPETSLYFSQQLGVAQCFNLPTPELAAKASDGEAESYEWGSPRWEAMMWLKVHAVRSVYALGFHVLYCDMDVSWFNDPIDYFMRHMDGPARILTTADMTTTYNAAGDEGLEAGTNPWQGINAGVFFLKQWPEGLQFIAEWLKWKGQDIGRCGDQDGLNILMRGTFFNEQRTNFTPIMKDEVPRTFFGSINGSVAISYLPPSMFANQYTYVNAQFHKLLNHPLYEVHWVWGGNTLESKRQSMRDATKFVDTPAYYEQPDLLSIEMDYPVMPPGHNNVSRDDPFGVESMIQFHLQAAEAQLQQLYYGFAMAVALNRTVLLPRLRCFCSKNWYPTTACRINDDFVSQFPFTCALSQVLRSKKLTNGYPIKDVASGTPRILQVREYSFLENRRTSAAIKASRLVVQPTAKGRGGALTLDELRALVPPLGATEGGTAVLLSLPWPLDDQELAALLEPHRAVRAVHFVQPARLFGPGVLAAVSEVDVGDLAPNVSRRQGSFRDAALQFEFDKAMFAATTYWCCRAPHDIKKMNRTDLTVRVEHDIVPAMQRQLMHQQEPGLSHGHRWAPDEQSWG